MVIRSSIEEVFAFVSNSENWRQLRPAAREDEQLPRGPMRVGDRFVQDLQVPGQRIELPCEVTEYKPDERLSLGYSWNSLTLELDFIVEPTGEGTKLTGRGEGHASGFYALMEPLITLEVNREVRTGLENFKSLLESKNPGNT